MLEKIQVNHETGQTAADKINKAFDKIDNFQGGQGAQGPQGPQGPAGPQGADSTIQGPVGPQGTDGVSAYQLWLTQGNTGTHQNFLDSLVGATGAQGIQGPQGNIGLTGPAGQQGPQGIQGKDGAGVTIKGSKTIQEILAIQNATDGDMYIATDTNPIATPPGTIGDGYAFLGGVWTNVGAIQGPQGVKGDQGVAGVSGAGLPTGGTQGQIITKKDATDFNTEWVDIPAGVKPADQTKIDFITVTKAINLDTTQDNVQTAFDRITALGLQAPTQAGDPLTSATDIIVPDQALSQDPNVVAKDQRLITVKNAFAMEIGLKDFVEKAFVKLDGTSELEATYVPSKDFHVVTKKYVDSKSGADVKLDGYTKPAASGPILVTDSVNDALGKLEKHVDDATAGGGDKNVQSDWTQTDTTKDDFIKNKPTITNGVDGKTPSIDGTSKHWMIGTTDTGVKAEGTPGVAGAAGVAGPAGTNGTGYMDAAINKNGHLTLQVVAADGTKTPLDIGNVTGADGKNGTGITVKGSKANEAAIKTIQGSLAGDMWIAADTGHGWVSDGNATASWTDAGTIQGPKGDTGVAGPTGPAGTAGTNGTDGKGLPTGGTKGQIIEKIDGTDFNTKWVTPTPVEVVDDVVTDSSTKALSAKQGKLLEDARALTHTAVGANTAAIALKADRTYVDTKVKTDVPLNAKFTDTQVTVIDALDKDDTDKALSAKQGKALKALITAGALDYTKIMDVKSAAITDVAAITETGIYYGGAMGAKPTDPTTDVTNSPVKGPVMVMASKDANGNFGYFLMGSDQVLHTGGKPKGGSTISWAHNVDSKDIGNIHALMAGHDLAYYLKTFQTKIGQLQHSTGQVTKDPTSDGVIPVFSDGAFESIDVHSFKANPLVIPAPVLADGKEHYVQFEIESGKTLNSNSTWCWTKEGAVTPARMYTNAGKSTAVSPMELHAWINSGALVKIKKTGKDWFVTDVHVPVNAHATGTKSIIDDGSVPMQDAYVPSKDQDVVTKKFLESNAGGVSSGLFQYDYLIKLAVDPTPAAKHISFDNTDFSKVTKVYINKKDRTQTDMSLFLKTIIPGDYFNIHDNGNINDFIAFDVTGAAVQHGDIFEIPVKHYDDNGTFKENERVYVHWNQQVKNPFESTTIHAISDIKEGGIFTGENLADAPVQGKVNITATQDSSGNIGLTLKDSTLRVHEGGIPTGGTVHWKHVAPDHLSGTADPVNTLGHDGDIYFKLT